MSAKMSPVAMLILQNGKTRLVNVKNQDVLTRLLDLIPEAIDKIAGGAVSPEARNTAKEMLQRSSADEDGIRDALQEEIEIVGPDED